MKTFDEKLQAELDKLPFESGADDGIYNDGVLDGFELGARWVAAQPKEQETHSEVGEIEPSNSYHDTTVIVNGVAYHIYNTSYGLRLQCCRVDGWRLWHNEKLIGGEYDETHFQIRLGKTIVFDNKLNQNM